MSLLDRYQSETDLPESLPVFPLGGVLLLPRTQIPLNIFEPRYLEMVDAALSGSRLIGMIQPDGPGAMAEQGNPDAKPPLQKVGCAGRITSYSETGDGRILITLTGISRFRLVEELPALTPFRQVRADFTPFADDLKEGLGEDQVDRAKLLDVLKRYLEHHSLKADWRAIENSGSETLVNSLCIISPYGPAEKQALLEAKTLAERNEMLVALTEMALAGEGNDSTNIQ
ncbi:LON peptidase substrate-binding domain-containing protein [Tepidicaulis sp. LMO-SS28]|uniref:LON peptidase substrate-binding domain-containing protein n=1 Tax=Tepidicaulis sp. LMO-SS28 TaxID=3447455 RepID=UPI003EE2E7DA